MLRIQTPSNPNAITLCLGGSLRNQKSRRSLYAHTLLNGKVSETQRAVHWGWSARDLKRACCRAVHSLTRNTASFLVTHDIWKRLGRITMPQNNLSETERTTTLSLSSFPAPVSHCSKLTPWGMNFPLFPGLLAAGGEARASIGLIKSGCFSSLCGHFIGEKEHHILTSLDFHHVFFFN